MRELFRPSNRIRIFYEQIGDLHLIDGTFVARDETGILFTVSGSYQFIPASRIVRIEGLG